MYGVFILPCRKLSNKQPDNGFSLVELSIVLVILGLLTGGILAGQSLIRAAELRAVTAEYQRWATATQTFRDKYMANPGDFRDATRFWGFSGTATAPGCVSNAGITTVSSPGTCDGNSNGITDPAANGNTSEYFQFWRHLALAGLIEGTYSGLPGSGGRYDAVINSNSPSSRITNGGWSMGHRYSTYAGESTDFAVEYGNFFVVGGYASNDLLKQPIFKPEEAWNIDSKLDDGRPAQGRIIARYWNNLCTAPDSGAAAANNLNASYRLSDSSIQCSLNFVRQF